MSSFVKNDVECVLIKPLFSCQTYCFKQIITCAKSKLKQAAGCLYLHRHIKTRCQTLLIAASVWMSSQAPCPSPVDTSSAWDALENTGKSTRPASAPFARLCFLPGHSSKQTRHYIL
uniref:Uncharacterized protein n=1 Tax=Pundamilia nyererei TaxID=303518 RepID=A0A3B4H469_9CICH